MSILVVLCASVVNGFSLDREAFSFTSYDLNVQVEPEQHRLGVRGKVTLRNDSARPQKIAVLQISSSLDWRSIKVSDGTSGGKAVQFVTQPFTSDIDHTGGLSEAIVTLPQAVAPKGTIDLDIAYEGVVLLDATRLTRIGTPEDVAASADWDRIVRDFVAIRGAGNVAWYPIATEAANLSDDGSMPEVLARWKLREAGARTQLHLSASPLSVEGWQEVLINGNACADLRTESSRNQGAPVECAYQAESSTPLSLVVKDYSVVKRPGIEVHSLPSRGTNGVEYADLADKLAPWIAEWFGSPREKAKIVDLPYPDAVSFENGSLLFMSLGGYEPSVAGMVLTHELTHASFFSPRPWIEEGMAHFTQALFVEHLKNRQAALDYLRLHRSAFIAAEKSGSKLQSEGEDSRALVNTAAEEIYRSKAMCVWWMLRDLVGDAALKKAIAAYRAEDDNDPAYMPRLIAAQTQRDLGWFFDDWVYHDRGLPDFKVASAFSQATATNSFMVTITLENLGTAGAEVPVIVKFAGGDTTKRLEVRAKNRATIRVEVPRAPQEIVVNDRSVPESDMTNNTFKVETAQN